MHDHGAHGFIGILNYSVVITGFVFVMMVVLEYVNVLSRGRFHIELSAKRGKQYLLAVLLGLLPGCLGSFAAVSMFSHGVISFGAIVATMTATVGDEAFLLLSTMPGRALMLMAGLSVLGMFNALILDRLMRSRKAVIVDEHDMAMEIHDEKTECFAKGRILAQWRNCTPARGILAAVLLVFILTAVSGHMEVYESWMKATLAGVSVLALLIVSTVPDHFLDEHLWEHIARKHVPRILLWTFGAMFMMDLIVDHLHMEHLKDEGAFLMLVFACLIGLIPVSGPHFVFVVGYAQGVFPLSVLVANMIVQDGHGLLPMLAHSRRVFFEIKMIKLIMALLIGGILLACGL